MARDLGMSSTEVHRWTHEILDFWLVETPPEGHFAKDDALDREIAARFGALRARVKEEDAAGWRDDPKALLAAVILFDQFSRNMFRGQAEAFATDALARDLARLALSRGWDATMTPEERQFLYLPFMHSEDDADQALCVRLFAALDEPEALDYARRHADQIARFGRFPQRNAALGRESTPQEIELLSRPGEMF
ncbi:DUF924 family protein [Sphingomonas cavernae]|uniref:DUF924 domain-containing protein n=1 Tax=Sphingomonas cavernae TaxID=2320861 RepID=A0A418WM02_9SPHN|nr:DUF924 family protein [Sphingomonas cavernae]RJF91028.1 DUF924 domain-containing protein [Sphingomonas cavernae]